MNGDSGGSTLLAQTLKSVELGKYLNTLLIICACQTTTMAVCRAMALPLSTVLPSLPCKVACLLPLTPCPISRPLSHLSLYAKYLSVGRSLDYSSIGIVSMEDRKRLFQLIQTLKTDSYKAAVPVHMQQRTVQPDAAQPPASSVRSSVNSRVPVTTSNNRESPRSSHSSSTSREASSAFTVPVQQQQQLHHQPQQQQQSGSRLLNAYGVPSKPAQQQTSSRSLNAYGIPNATASSESFAAPSQTSRSSIATLTQSSSTNSTERIRVCVRKRPLNQRELRKNEQDITTVVGKRTLIVNELKYVLLFYSTFTHNFTE